ncbi:MAG: hypothetical protein LBR25_02695 [Erysipelotrichaceae bacterium]|jgi:hypothetical protein|nr:hypothetical protein [Erysipelotrichaceae bacterium]
MKCIYCNKETNNLYDYYSAEKPGKVLKRPKSLADFKDLQTHHEPICSHCLKYYILDIRLRISIAMGLFAVLFLLIVLKGYGSLWWLFGLVLLGFLASLYYLYLGYQGVKQDVPLRYRASTIAASLHQRMDHSRVYFAINQYKDKTK